MELVDSIDLGNVPSMNAYTLWMTGSPDLAYNVACRRYQFTMNSCPVSNLILTLLLSDPFSTVDCHGPADDRSWYRLHNFDHARSSGSARSSGRGHSFVVDEAGIGLACTLGAGTVATCTLAPGVAEDCTLVMVDNAMDCTADEKVEPGGHRIDRGSQ